MQSGLGCLLGSLGLTTNRKNPLTAYEETTQTENVNEHGRKKYPLCSRWVGRQNPCIIFHAFSNKITKTCLSKCLMVGYSNEV